MNRVLVAVPLLLAVSTPCAQARTRTVRLVKSGGLSNKNMNATTSFVARRGQTVKASVKSTTREFYPILFITSPSGKNLIQFKQTSYSARLRETGRYRVRVGVNMMATNALRGNYTLRLRVR